MSICKNKIIRKKKQNYTILLSPAKGMTTAIVGVTMPSLLPSCHCRAHIQNHWEALCPFFSCFNCQISPNISPNALPLLLASESSYYKQRCRIRFPTINSMVSPCPKVRNSTAASLLLIFSIVCQRAPSTGARKYVRVVGVQRQRWCRTVRDSFQRFPVFPKRQ